MLKINLKTMGIFGIRNGTAQVKVSALDLA